MKIAKLEIIKNGDGGVEDQDNQQGRVFSYEYSEHEREEKPYSPYEGGMGYTKAVPEGADDDRPWSDLRKDEHSRPSPIGQQQNVGHHEGHWSEEDPSVDLHNVVGGQAESPPAAPWM